MECVKRTIRYDYLIIDTLYTKNAEHSSTENFDNLLSFHKKACKENDFYIFICNKNSVKHLNDDEDEIVVEYEDNEELFTELAKTLSSIHKKIKVTTNDFILLKIVYDIDFPLEDEDDEWNFSTISLKEIEKVEETYNQVFEDGDYREMNGEYELTYKNSKLLYRKYRYPN